MRNAIKTPSAAIVIVSALLGLASPVHGQINCEPLKPHAPKDLDMEATGKIDGKLQRLISLGGTIDGSYKEASRDVLKEYPNADKLYLWDRLIYLNCESLRVLSIPDNQKFDKLNALMDRIGRPPAENSLQK